MIYNYIAIGVVIVSIGVIVWIISKKFPVISAINIESLEKHRLEKVKQGIIADRLKRKFSAIRIKNIFTRGGGSEPSVLHRAYSTLKQLEQKYHTKIREIEPAGEVIVEKQNTVVMDTAQSLAKEGKFKEAEAKYIEAISLNKKSAEAYRGLGELYVQMKSYDHALEIFQYLLKLHATATGGSAVGTTAVSLNTEMAEDYKSLAEVYLSQNRLAESMQSYREAIKLEPNNPRYLDALIRLAITLKQKDVANEYLEKLAAANPDNEKLSDLRKEIRLL